ncbi:kelch-like protein 21 [Amblyraja radiata]|uniref:kelch-like protein 21 n=1 Tax=Amblyraja radiata TaxID=386614 RepID=UPI001402C1F3|nr:kelch-like protein 21 [Amblyraja radiata]XP_032904030.1 kelch-like protein 21 [Amblyraja radiata]XP_032904031.1 kelch-like protein 21 [Amblyraja radiata]XP_032904032.1 kelch-like protein 21 [Amblyraja radiata]XP_032904033.1 kelch-like protein 21 [Amblyraja radiata]XP_032904034.1 kelch-like protein 21 [Amblyraja radiata]
MERPSMLTQTSVLPFFDPSHALNILQGINDLRVERKFFDMTLWVDGQEFPCHRTVLAAASHYFKAMFAGWLKESYAERVELHGVKADTLGLLLDFSYTGRVTVTQGNVEPLARAADLFQFHSVKEACCAYLEHQLDVNNCLEIQEFAEAYACRSLAESAKGFILRHIIELSEEKEFEALPQRRLLEYLSDDRLHVDKEEAAYQLALRWVKADPKRRLRFWPELFEHVRLPFIRRFYLLAYVESDPLVYYSPFCLKLIHQARAFQSSAYDRHDYPCERMRARPSTGLAEILVVVGGCDKDCDELATVDCFNPQTGQWRYLAEFPDNLAGGYSITAFGNDIYVTGGSDGTSLYDSVWRYNSSVNEWTEVSPMLQAHEYHSSVVLKGHIYILAPNSLERYDHSVDSWEALQPMPYPMDNCSSTACRGKLYTIGTLAGKESMAIQCYDPDANLWTMVMCGSLPPWAFVPKTVTLNGLIYFVQDDSSEVDVYNPTKNEWGKIPPMNQVHVGGSVAALGGKLVVSGGYDNTFELSGVIEAFNFQTGSWSIVGHLPQPTFWHGSVSIFRQFMPTARVTFESSTNDNHNNEINRLNLARYRRQLHNENLRLLH